MEQNLIFRVHIHEGTGFGTELQALVCHVTLGDSTRGTNFSAGRDKHVFGPPLQWSTSQALWRRLASAGQFVCKVTVYKKTGSGPLETSPSTKDLTKLGWVVLDLRQAKLNQQYNKDQGEWCPLIGSKTGSDAPRLRISYHLGHEDLIRQLDAAEQHKSSSPGNTKQPPQPKGARPSPSPMGGPAPPQHPPSSTALPGPPMAAAAEASHSSHYESDFTASPEGSQPSLRAASAPDGGGGMVAGPPTAPVPAATATPPAADHNARAGGPPVDADPQAWAGRGGADAATGAALSAAPGAAAGGAPPQAFGVADGPLKGFCLTLDVRSFQASRHLPLSVCNVYVQATLPHDVREVATLLGARIPTRLSPLTSRPPVEVARGAEQPIPNGVGSLDFVCGVLRLAHVLSRDPRVIMEVYHKERDRSDTLLGVASVPLSPLLHDCWVDGIAPVYARTAPGQGGPDDKVQVGTLRVVLSLQDSPATDPTTTTAGSPQRAPLPAAAPPPALLPARAASPPPVPAPAAAPWTQPQFSRLPAAQPVAAQPPQPQWQAGAPPQPPPWGHVTSVSQPVPQPGPASLADIQQSQEYSVAYQLEVWKKEEEARWRQELRQREAARMQLLEGEWRKRERAREQEVAAMRAEYTQLDARARQVLASAEDRERRLIGVEEAAALRRKDMEREHAARMTEAEAAVRRLQVECEHQLEIERDRHSEVSRLRNAAEERLVASEARATALEQAFAAYREQMRHTSEAALSREVLELQDALRRAQERADKAHRDKVAYKQQVVRLAEQLASAHRQLQEGAGRSQRAAPADLLGGHTLQLAAEQQARYAVAQQGELSTMRQQLAALKVSVLGSPLPASNRPALPGQAPAGSPGVIPTQPSPRVAGDWADVRSVQDQGRRVQAASPLAAVQREVHQPPSVHGNAPAGQGASPQQQQAAPDAWAPRAPERSPGHVTGAGNNPPPPGLTPTRSRPIENPDVAARDVERDTHQEHAEQGHGATDLAILPGDVAQTGLPGVGQNLAEVQRLLRRKSELLATGAYPPDDPLIQRIEARVAELAGVP